MQDKKWDSVAFSGNFISFTCLLYSIHRKTFSHSNKTTVTPGLHVRPFGVAWELISNNKHVFWNDFLNYKFLLSLISVANGSKHRSRHSDVCRCIRQQRTSTKPQWSPMCWAMLLWLGFSSRHQSSHLSPNSQYLQRKTIGMNIGLTFNWMGPYRSHTHQHEWQVYRLFLVVSIQPRRTWRPLANLDALAATNLPWENRIHYFSFARRSLHYVIAKRW